MFECIAAGAFNVQELWAENGKVYETMEENKEYVGKMVTGEDYEKIIKATLGWSSGRSEM